MWNKQLFEVWGLTIKRKGSFSPFFDKYIYKRNRRKVSSKKYF